MSIDIVDLIQVTVKYLKKRNLSDMPKESCSKNESCWGQMTEEIFGEFNRTKSLQIYTMWKRNYKNYKNNVNEILKNGNIYFKIILALHINLKFLEKIICNSDEIGISILNFTFLSSNIIYKNFLFTKKNSMSMQEQ